jgi:hypothetical protein
MKHTEQVANLLRLASRETAFSEHVRSDGTAVRIPKQAATAGVISLKGVELSPPAGDTRSLRSDQAVPAGKLVLLSATLAQQSRVAQAGTTVIIHAPAPKAHGDGNGTIVLMERPNRFVLIEAAPFATVADGSEVQTTDASILRATLTFSGPSYGVSHNFTRRDISDYGFDSLAEQAMESIALGLARACDHAVLSAIVATDPGAFSIGAVASAGFDWSELRSFVGTNGDGAAVAADGALRAAGVPAVLSPTIAVTVAGTFSRAAVAVLDDLRVIVDRRGLHGGLTVTAWADIRALLPNSSAFWSIAANDAQGPNEQAGGNGA